MLETDSKNLDNLLENEKEIAKRKKIRFIILGVAALVIIVVIIIIIASVKNKNTKTQSDSQGDTKIDKLPQHMVTGYWHNFCNGSTNLKLSDVPSYYDMICVAFTGNTATPGEVTFELDSYLASTVGGYSKKEFIQDIKDIKSKGRHVIISVGGANGRIVIDSEKASDKFASSLIEIIKEYGFEGVDIDLEGSAVSGTEYIASGLRKAHDEFGDDFIITMAPETYYMHKADGLMGAYYRLAIKIKDILTICYPQFYNAGGDIGYNNFNARYPSQSFITSLATMYIENGLRPDQMAIGVPAAASAGGTGYISTDALKEVINSLVYKKELDGFTPPREYKTLRGVMTWSINWDGTQNYAWGKSMSELMNSLPIVDRGSERPEQDEKKSDETDDKESDNTSDSSEDEGTGDIPAWDSSKAYFKGDRVVYKGKIYEAKWWTQGDIPDEQDQWGPWKYIRDA
jgi:chitinase